MLRKIVIIFLLSLIPRTVIATDSVTITNDYIVDIKDGDDKTYNDKSLRLDFKQVYLTGFFGDWQHGFEIGGYIKEKRRSA